MDRSRDVLAFFSDSDGFVSGDRIASALSVSRTAIWKCVSHLEKLGYEIEKVKGKGYRLLKRPEKPFPWEIEPFLDTEWLGRKIIFKDAVDSTNSYAYRLALDGEPEGTCVLADAQRTGRGRLNRQWFAPPGKNLYLSIILRPSVHPSKVSPITFLSSLAVYDAVATITGRAPTLKWPNDVLINGRKICGTLLELSTEADRTNFVVVGIGLNVNMRRTDLRDDIREKATSLLMESRKSFERARVCAILLSGFERYYRLFRNGGGREILDLWEQRAGVKGKEIEIVQMDERYHGVAEGIDGDGAMLLNTGGVVKRVLAGDVTF
jgi:BirA family transcriptional regulator, biotin operon repressor / biotin---[acetyl-CoA-carboxylase] ligase